MNRYGIGCAMVLLSATGFGLLPVFALFAYDSGVNVPTLLLLRFVFASFAFFFYLAVTGKRRRVTMPQAGSLMLMGSVLYTLQSACYFSAVQYIPAPLAALLLYLYPVFVAVLSFFVNGERLSRQGVLSLAVSLTGMVPVLGFPSGEISMTGVLLAIGAAVVYSVYIVYGNRVTAHIEPAPASAWISLFAALSFGVWGAATGRLDFHIQPTGWLSIAGVALCSTVIAMFAFFAGMRIIGPTRASILSMFEPLMTILFSALLLGDHLTLPQLAGGLVVLAGTAFATISKEQAKERPVQKSS